MYVRYDELYHFGIPGMKWYVRRYQNPDGTLTPAGKARYVRMNKKYARITGKIKKTETKQDKAKYKENKYENKYMVSKRKGERQAKKLIKKYGSIEAAPSGLLSRRNRYENTIKRTEKYNRKMDKNVYKGNKYENRYIKLNRKGERMARKIEKYFGNAVIT